MSRRLLLLLLLFLPFFPVPHRAAAIEPVTMMILAPIALKGARHVSPYVISGMKNSGRRLVCVGKDFVSIFSLPLGVGQSLFGWPFGYLNLGLENIGTGLIAPARMTVDLVLVPLEFFGLSF